MARSKESLKIDIDQSTSEETRTILVTITAPAEDFLLPDLLSQRGAVDPYDGTLKQAIREATEGYLGGADELIAGIATAKQGQKGEAPASISKSNDAGKKAKSKREKPSEEGAMSSIPPIAPGPVNGSIAHQ
jgi:hypothetical protein